VANFTGYSPQAVPRFGSQVMWDDPVTLPAGLARIMRNGRYAAESAGTRYGLKRMTVFGQGNPIGGFKTLRYISPSTSAQADVTIIACTQRDGNIWAVKPVAGATPLQLTSDALIALANIRRQTGYFSQCTQAFNRMYIAQSDMLQGVAPALQVDGSNLASLNVYPISDAPFGAGWQVKKRYRAGHVVSATNQNGPLKGVLFRATTTGMSGSAEPQWPTAEGLSVPDAGVAWQRIQIVASTGLTPASAPAFASNTANVGSAFANGMTAFFVCTWVNQFGESVGQVVNAAGTLGNVTQVVNNSGHAVNVTLTLPTIPADIAALPAQYLPTGSNLYAYFVTGTPDPTKIIDPSYYALVGSFAVHASVTVSAFPVGQMLPTLNTAYVSEAGNVSSGTRFMIVLYLTRTGYVTGVSDAVPIACDITQDGRKILVQNIPVGPYNCVARICAFTVAGDGSAGPYYYIPFDDFANPGNGAMRLLQTATLIADNTTTSAYFDFIDPYLEGSVNVTEYFDRIEVPPPTDIFFSKSLNRVIYCGCPGYDALVSDLLDPESVRVPGSNIAISPSDGDRTVCVREIRGNTLAFKENGGFPIVPADGQDPTDWGVPEGLWHGMGPVTARAIDIFTADDPGQIGEEFAVFAHQSGGYRLTQGAPSLITRELMGTVKKPGPWRRINWSYGHLVRVVIDPIHREARFHVPLDGATENTHTLTCNYYFGWDEPLVLTRNGTLVANRNGRKWSVDDIAANDGEYLPQRYGFAAPFPPPPRIMGPIAGQGQGQGGQNGSGLTGLLITSNLPAARNGVPYFGGFSASGGQPPYTFAITDGALPPGLDLVETGGITGIPSNNGTFTLTVTVTDSSAAGAPGAGTFSITVAEAGNTQPAVDAMMLIAGIDGALYAVADGQYHDDTYAGTTGYFSQWLAVPTASVKLGLLQIGGATISWKGSGDLNLYVVDDQEFKQMLSSETRRATPITDAAGDPVETVRDLMLAHPQKGTRYGMGWDNGGVADAWWEMHEAILWVRPWMAGRRA